MKNILAIFASLFLFTACDKDDNPWPNPGPGDYRLSTPFYIGQYADGKFGLSIIKQTDPLYPGQRLDDQGIRFEIVDPVYYQDPFLKVSNNAGLFLWAAERYGDRRETYFDTSDYLHIGIIALYIEILSIDVTSNKAWDEAHPAGTLLNDLIELSIFSYADYIDNGYQGEISWEAKKLSEVTTEDFRLISPEFSFYFKKTPDVIDEHRLKFKIRMKFAFPEEQVYEISCIPTRSIR